MAKVCVSSVFKLTIPRQVDRPWSFCRRVERAIVRRRFKQIQRNSRMKRLTRRLKRVALSCKWPDIASIATRESSFSRPATLRMMPITN
jgi:hypothetical protein